MIKGFSMNSFVAGFMLGALFVGGWFIGDPSSILPSSTTPTPRGTDVKAATSTESGAISVADQPAGMEVVVESLTVPPPGVWAAVREVNGVDLGNVLGAVRVEGPRANVTIPLLRATEPGLPYAVELYRDDGGGEFDLARDSVYVDFASGQPVVARFTTTQ